MEEMSSEGSSSSFSSIIDSTIAKADNKKFVSWAVKSYNFRFLVGDMNAQGGVGIKKWHLGSNFFF